MVHDLQEHVVDVDMCLLDLVEHHHTVGVLVDGVGQLTTLVEADIARRRANQARHAGLVHVLGHVESVEGHAKHLGELARELGLADAGRASEQEAADGLVGGPNARAVHLDGIGDGRNGLVLAEDDALQVFFEVLESRAIFCTHTTRRNACDARHGELDVLHLDVLTALEADRSPDLVEDVDRLVGQLPLVDVPAGERRAGLDGVFGVRHFMMVFVGTLQAAKDLHGIIDAWLVDVDVLESTGKGFVLAETGAVLFVGRRPDAAEGAVGERWLEEVGGIECTAAGGARTDDHMNLIDEEDGLRVVFERCEHRLQTLLKVAAVPGTRHEGTHVEGVDVDAFEHLGNVSVDDTPGKTLDNGCLTHAAVADEEGVVLSPAGEHVNDTLDFIGTTDERIDLSVDGALVEVVGEIFERGVSRGCGTLLGVSTRALWHPRRPGLAPALADTVADVGGDIELVDALLGQQVDGLGLLLTEERDEHIATITRRLSAVSDVVERPLNDPMKAHGLHGVIVARAFDLVDIFERLNHVGLQLSQVGAAGLENLRGLGVVQQGMEQMLGGEVLVSMVARELKGAAKGDAKVVVKAHSGSMVH